MNFAHDYATPTPAAQRERLLATAGFGEVFTRPHDQDRVVAGRRLA